MSVFRGLAFSSLLLILNGCEAIWSFSNQLEIPSGKSNEIRVVAVNHPLSWNKDQANGIEKDLIESFAKEVGYKVKWMLTNSANDSVLSLKNNRADVAIGRLNLNLAYENQLLPGPSYEESPLVLVCPKVSTAIDEDSSFFRSLFGHDVRIPSKVKHVAAIKSDLYGDWMGRFQSLYPGLEVVPVQNRQGKDLLSIIAKNRSACALLEQTEAKYYLRFYPSLQIIRELTPPMSIGFLVSPERVEVQKLLFSWFQRASRTREIMKIRDRYTGHLDSLDEMDQIRLFRTMQTELPALLPKFKAAAKEFQLPWQLVAAVAYQESHWKNEAISFTGVRGIMMLTEETADHVGVDDRTDLTQSIWGGAKYLRILINAQPKNLTPRERMIFALATYNVGPAHMLDAQKLADRLGKNPYSWKDMKKVLPLLSSEEYFITLEHGEARGDEPVDFTNRVLGFFDLLNRY